MVGPSIASVGNIADIAVPEGCRFTDENGARTLLMNARQPVPGNLVGLLFPDTQKWFAVVQFTEIGHVKDADKESLDADAILKKYQKDLDRQNEEHVAAGARTVAAKVAWELKPSYNPSLNKLEYALKASSGAGGSLDYVVDWLGRRGTLSVTIVQPEQAALNLVALRDAVKGVAFKPGEAYSDYQPQDRVASLGLADLITDSDGAEPLSTWERLSANKWFWVGSAGGLLVLSLAGYGVIALFLRRRKVRYYRMDEKYQPVRAATNGAAQEHAAPANGQAQIRVNGGFQRNGHRRRKKRFSYHAFYSDMVMNLTRCNYVGSPGSVLHDVQRAAAGVEATSAQDLGQGHNAGMPDTANLLVAETSKLIQSQQKLIEGQRRLIEEQSKLIQEKSLLLGADAKPSSKQPEVLAGQ